MTQSSGATTDLAQPLRGELTWTLQTHEGLESVVSVTLQLDANDSTPWAWDAEPWALDTATLEDGEHHVTLRIQDKSGAMHGEQWSFVSDHTPPQVLISETSSPGSQGHTLPLILQSDAAVLSTTFLDQERTLYPLDALPNVYRALVGIPIPTEPGLYPLVVKATDELGNEATVQREVQIEDYPFQKGGYIRLSKKQTRARKNREAIDQANADRMTAYAVQSSAPMWGSGMMQPVEGRRTSEFGRYRTYSDGTKRPHYGTDLAAPADTPILAAAGGTVTLAKLQVIYGNVVIIDHGQGISTSYNHLNSISVSVGDTVEMGEEIGKLGSTGQSTGPHLHWGMTVEGLSVNAEQWVEQSFLPQPDGDWLPMEPFVPAEVPDHVAPESP